MDMDLRVLKYFLMVAREENITKAAQLLHVTQPTLSRQLMQLEEELGVQLFHRGKHNVTLTEDGIVRIAPQPIGRFLVNGHAILPTAAAVTKTGDGLRVTAAYPALGDASFSLRYRGGYAVLTLDSAPDAADAFVFGPYYVAMERFGDLLGISAEEANSLFLAVLYHAIGYNGI